MKVMYVGTLCEGRTGFQRMLAIRDLGYEVTPVDIRPDEVKKKERQLFNRVKRKVIGPSDIAGANEQILKLIKNNIYYILWIDKGLTIRPETLRTVKETNPKTIIAGYSPDDMINPDNQSNEFLKGLRYYDIFFTTKSYGVDELKELGCRRVEFIDNAYDPNTHRPVEISKEDKLKFGGPIGFIGAYERERAESILYLAMQGFPIRIWGSSWNKKKWLSHPNLRIENMPLWGDEYAEAICSFDINLNFLRKVNRDLQTTRSIEIPACGAFMLGERTDEHLRLFEENKEAVYFSSNDELIHKVHYFLEHDKEREQIAKAGRERCLVGGYSNQERIKILVQELCFLIEQPI
jgi:spore maturation protein CgeB